MQVKSYKAGNVGQVEIDERRFHDKLGKARVLYRTEPEDVEAVLHRRPNSKGARELRAIMRGKPISLTSSSAPSSSS